MLASDLKVEVRSGAYALLGRLALKDIELDADIPKNGVGKWTLRVSRDHRLAEAIMTPGSGLVVTDMSSSVVIFSGPFDDDEQSWTPDNPLGELVVNGITDEHVLEDALAWPDPANSNSMTQATATDSRTGEAETLLHEFVSANIGPTATAARRNTRLVLGEDHERGGEVTFAARWENLLALLDTISTGRNLLYRVTQYNGQLVFSTRTPGAAPKLLLDFSRNHLASARITRKAPSITRAYVGGAAGGVSRSFVERTTPASLAAEGEWSRRIERFVDQRSGTSAQLSAAGDDALNQGMETGVNARFEPNESLAATYGVDWNLGDNVRLHVDTGTSYTAPIASVKLLVNRSGVRVGCTVGDATIFSPTANLDRQFSSLASRLSYLETAF